MDDHLLQEAFTDTPFHYLLIHGVFGEVAINHDLARLSDPVRTVLRLQVALRVLRGGLLEISWKFLSKPPSSDEIKILTKLS